MEGRSRGSSSTSTAEEEEEGDGEGKDCSTKTGVSFPGFTFLSFDDDDDDGGKVDGEAIKATFKARLLEAETLLSQEERQEVVEMARELFERSILLVGEIDQMVLREKVVKAARAMLPSFMGLIVLFGVLVAWIARR